MRVFCEGCCSRAPHAGPEFYLIHLILLFCWRKQRGNTFSKINFTRIGLIIEWRMGQSAGDNVLFDFYFARHLFFFQPTSGITSTSASLSTPRAVSPFFFFAVFVGYLFGLLRIIWEKFGKSSSSLDFTFNIWTSSLFWFYSAVIKWLESSLWIICCPLLPVLFCFFLQSKNSGAIKKKVCVLL